MSGFNIGDYVYVKWLDATGYIDRYYESGPLEGSYKVVGLKRASDGRSFSCGYTFATAGSLVLLTTDSDEGLSDESLVSSTPLRSLFEVGI